MAYSGRENIIIPQVYFDWCGENGWAVLACLGQDHIFVLITMFDHNDIWSTFPWGPPYPGGGGSSLPDIPMMVITLHDCQQKIANNMK